MKITLITITVMIICISNAFADIAPNPIKAKGIVTSGETTIRMISERVIIDLYKDSSVVECHFFMKNEGKKQKINIGFPEMYFHHWEKTRATDFSENFLVMENGMEVQKMDMYIPDSGSQKKTRAKKSNLKYEEQPWYLWDSKFNEGETKIIKVHYSLPNGQNYKGSRYFTYLLNTGSGWMGSIDTAEVIVNVKDFSTDLILKTTPENYTIKENQIIWKFYNLEPTINDDIKIYYEPSKGYYEKKKTQKPEPTFVLNDEILLHRGSFDSKRFLDSITPNEILTIKILKDLKDTEKYTLDKEGVVLVYTKSYVIDKLKKLIKSTSSNTHLIAYNSSSDFIEKYKLVIDQTTYKGDELLLKLLELKEDEVQNVIIKKKYIGKTCIIIKRKN